MALRHFLLLCALYASPVLCGCPAPTVSVTSDSKKPTTVTVNPAPKNIFPLDKVTPPPGTFFTTPYLQLGENAFDPGSLAVVWHLPANVDAGSGSTAWGIETRSPAGSGNWTKQATPLRSNPVSVGGVAPHTVCSAAISGLMPGQPFDYRILRNGEPVFAARANRARPAKDQDFRMVLFGDCAEDTAWQKKVAHQTYQMKPDAVLITGDIVYPHGRASEYRANYFPVYASETADPRRGAPLLSSTLFIGLSGNHDIAYSNLAKYPDGMAYYYYWKQPLNGWGGGDSGEAPPVKGQTAAFLRAAGGTFPAGANFAFDYGNAHFVAIDANYYMNWQSPKMMAGLRKAITANPQAKWRFVLLHVAPFHTSVSHQKEQWMRRLAPLFEETGVDIVWSGHVHNYQRSRPLRFEPSPRKSSDGTVEGTFAIDSNFDGATVTKPDGVLYVVTGAGGAALYGKVISTSGGTSDAESFTAKYDASVHSLTELSVRGNALSVRQIDENGKEVDRWTVTK